MPTLLSTHINCRFCQTIEMTITNNFDKVLKEDNESITKTPSKYLRENILATLINRAGFNQSRPILKQTP